MGNLYNKRKYDYDAIFDAACDCKSDTEMAEKLGIPRRSFIRAKSQDEKFKAAYNEGRELYMQAIRDEAMQLWVKAMKNNNQAAILIFAMKNLFGWSDNANKSDKSADTQLSNLVDSIDAATKAALKKSAPKSKASENK